MAIGNYRAVLRSAVRGLWSGAIDVAQFDENMRLAISKFLTEGFNVGLAECGIKPDELTIDEQIILGEFIQKDTTFVEGFGEAIQQQSKVNKGKLTPLYQRTELWVNRYNEAKTRGKALACADRKARWQVNPLKESCSSCLKLNGKIKRLSFWNSQGILPQVANAPYLECHGFRCGCELVITDEPISKGPLPKLP